MSSYAYQDPPPIGAFGGRITWGVQRMILLFTAVFVGQLLVEVVLPNDPRALGFGAAPGGVIMNWLAFDTANVWRVWTPFTYMALHAGLSHLFFNMLPLYFFGPEVERTLGTRNFVYFFILCGAIGVLSELLIAMGAGDRSVVGASGAVMGVLVAYAYLAPNAPIVLFPIPIPFTAKGLVIVFIVINLLSALSMGGSQASWSTHLAGMAVGYLYMRFVPQLRKLNWKTPNIVPFRKRRKAPKEDLEKIGEAVDNIFDFGDKDKKK